VAGDVCCPSSTSPARPPAAGDVYRNSEPANASLLDNAVVVGPAEQWAKIDG